MRSVVKDLSRILLNMYVILFTRLSSSDSDVARIVITGFFLIAITINCFNLSLLAIGLMQYDFLLTLWRVFVLSRSMIVIVIELFFHSQSRV